MNFEGKIPIILKKFPPLSYISVRHAISHTACPAMHSFILCAFGVTQVGKFKKHYVPTGPEASNIKGIDKNKCPQLLGKKKCRLQKYFQKCEQWLFHAMGFRQFFISTLYFFVLFEVFIVCVHYIYEKK